MTAPILLCMLPAERVALVPRIVAAGAVGPVRLQGPGHHAEEDEQ